MSNYNKATNFAVKDTLTSGDPDKVVSGAEIDNEFNSIASAVTSKADKVPAATTDNLAGLDANGNLKDSGDSVSSIITQAIMPSGSVTMFAATSAPSGWLECDGSNVSRSTYSDLFNAIGTTFGTGDGSTTFGLPDLRGEFVRGWDNGRGVDNGRSFGTAQLDQMQRIVGTARHPRSQFNHVYDSVNGVFSSSGNDSGTNQRIDQQTTTGTRKRLRFDSADSPNARVSATTDGETRPRNVALMYIIKT